MNQLCPDLTRDNWSAEEDSILTRNQVKYGHAWSQIAQFLPGRSANAVKNRWTWLLRRKTPLPVDDKVAGHPAPPPTMPVPPTVPAEVEPPKRVVPDSFELPDFDFAAIMRMCIYEQPDSGRQSSDLWAVFEEWTLH
jgi:hypothetical protein